jgi:hypothetical protein
MSHIGLARTTFAIPTADLNIAAEYKLLSNAAVVRTESLDRHGRWIPDNTVYPLKGASPAKAETASIAFKGYVPPAKARDAKVQLIHESEVVKGPRVMSPRASSPTRTETLNNRRGYILSSRTASRDAVAGSLERTSPMPASNDQSAEHHRHLLDDDEIFDYHQLSASTLLSPTLYDANAMVASMQPLASPRTDVVRNQGASVAGRCILDWQDDTQPQSTMPNLFRDELFSSREDVLQHQSTIPNDCDGELLISFNEVDEVTLSGSGPAGSDIQSAVMELEEVTDRLARLEQFKSSNNDLICLDYDEPPAQEQAQETSVSKAFNHGPDDENSPLEAQEQDLISNDSLRFGLMEEEPRVLYRTMNQKGGRALRSPGKAAPSPKGNSSRAKQAPAKRSQSIQSSARRETSTPAEPRRNPEVSLQHDPGGHILTECPF